MSTISPKEIQTARSAFTEQMHDEFLYLKGYGTYAYMSSVEVSRLFDTYLDQLERLSSTTHIQHEHIFMRSFIKSLNLTSQLTHGNSNRRMSDSQKKQQSTNNPSDLNDDSEKSHESS